MPDVHDWPDGQVDAAGGEGGGAGHTVMQKHTDTDTSDVQSLTRETDMRALRLIASLFDLLQSCVVAHE